MVGTYHPRWIALLGVGAYRTGFDCPRARIGLQPDTLLGVRLWLLPSPSGANGSYPLVDLVRELRAFRKTIDQSAEL